LDLNKIYNLDCEKGIEKLEDRSIDLLLTDPPYGIGDKTKLTKVGDKIVSNNDAWGKKYKDEWNDIDLYFKWLIDIINKTKPKLKNNGSMIMFLDRKWTGYFIYVLEQHGWKFRNKIYFEKSNPIPHFRKNNYRSTVEEAIWFTKTKDYKINFIGQKEMKQVFKGSIGSNKTTNHPNEKYDWMIKPLIKRHSNKGDTVLDLFSGSGAISVYSKLLKRNFVSFEKNEEFVNMGYEWLSKLDKDYKKEIKTIKDSKEEIMVQNSLF
jgi:DNA modification methylase